MSAFYSIHKALTQSVVDLSLGVTIAHENVDFDPSDHFILGYDAQTVNFTVGLVITGATSGAVGTIVLDSDLGTTGTLTLNEITGAFENNEVITDSGSGSATTDGTLSQIEQFIDLTDLPASKTSLDKSLADEATGFYQISIYTKSGASVRSPIEIADTIMDFYKHNVKLVDGLQTVIIENSNRNAGRNDNGWYIIDVSIEYRTNILR